MLRIACVPRPCRALRQTSLARANLGGRGTGTAALRGRADQLLGEVDRDDRQHDQHRADHVDDRRLVGPEQVLEDPDRQGLYAGAGGERGHDDLVEAQRERQQPAGEQRRAAAAGTSRTGTSGTCRRRGPPTPPRGSRRSAAAGPARCCRPRPRRRWRARRPPRTGPRRRRPITERNALSSAMPVTMPGSAIGSTTSSDTRVAAEEAVPLHREGRPCVPSTSAIAVAPRPALTESTARRGRPSLFHAGRHHWVVRPGGGQANVRSALNELTSTTTSGT